MRLYISLPRPSGGRLRWKANLSLAMTGRQGREPAAQSRPAAYPLLQRPRHQARVHPRRRPARRLAALPRACGANGLDDSLVRRRCDACGTCHRRRRAVPPKCEPRSSGCWSSPAPNGLPVAIAKSPSTTRRQASGAVVFRHAPVADSNPATQPASIDEAKPRPSPARLSASKNQSLANQKRDRSVRPTGRRLNPPSDRQMRE